jgi:hypothetical protein
MSSKAVVYLRSRPCEPEASASALALQRVAVQAYIEQKGLVLAAEFIELEDGGNEETRPAFAAALRTAASLYDRNLIQLVIASRAAIGSGKPFVDDPDVTDSTEHNTKILFCELFVETDSPSPSIALPAGSPGGLCIYADCRHDQLYTRIYLCNADSHALSDVTVQIENIGLDRYFSETPEEHRTMADHMREEHLSDLAPNTCVLVSELSHIAWDQVNRYVLTFTDSNGLPRRMVADDYRLDVNSLAEDPNKVWVAFELQNSPED